MIKIKRIKKGKCVCIENYSNKKLREKYPNFPIREYKVGEIYDFEYKPDKDECWLYYLHREDKEALCNWSFFDKIFKIIEGE